MCCNGNVSSFRCQLYQIGNEATENIYFVIEKRNIVQIYINILNTFPTVIAT